MPYRFSICVVIMAIMVAWLKLGWLQSFCLSFAAYLASGGWKFVRLLWLTLPRDLRFVLAMSKVNNSIRKAQKENLTVCDIFQETASKHRNKVAFVFEDKQWTFEEVEHFSNKVANYFQNLGYEKGDVVALFMENRPELVLFWLGLAKIGVISSLINNNLRKESLSYCISIVNAKGLIYSSDGDIISKAVADISTNLDGIELIEFGEGNSNGLKSQNILEEFKDCSDNPPSLVPERKFDDVLLYIYTSGTTGLPKASVITNFRCINIAYGFRELAKITLNDVIYCALPLYHTAGGVVGVGSVFLNGSTLVVRRKFSASRFWDECIKYKATVVLYIGELCRYLLAQPIKEADKMHSLRLITGNGLRPQIWNEFKARFNIPHIAEFYGSTEGNIGLMNTVSHPGAIGFLPPTISGILPVRIFKMNPVSGELLRGSDGFCIPCTPGEVGQIAGKVVKNDVSRHFGGYLNKKASEKKVARDVLKKGDQWFLSGDAIYWDELGFAYFHDRLGDTFRWCGENVSTTEVEGAILKVLGLKNVVVYGVEVAGCEGRAGMAAIEDPDDVIDFQILRKKLAGSLPSYAIPIFLRITSSTEVTGTFKFQKEELKREGFDPTLVEDKLFYFDLKLGEYCPLTKDIHRKILDGEMRV